MAGVENGVPVFDPRSPGPSRTPIQQPLDLSAYQVPVPMRKCHLLLVDLVWRVGRGVWGVG